MTVELGGFERTSSSKYGPKLKFTVNRGNGIFESSVDNCEWDITHHQNLYGNTWEIDRTPSSLQEIENQFNIEIPRDELYEDQEVAFKIPERSLFLEPIQVSDGMMEILKESLSYTSEYWDDNKHKMRTYQKNMVLDDGIPIGLKDQVEDTLEELDVNYSIIDYRKSPDILQIDVEWNFPHELRDYQKETVSKMMMKSCVVQQPTGAGKTIEGLRAIYELGVPTLILVHRIDLLDQWQEEIREVLGVEPGIVQGDTVEFRDITVAMIPSLVNRIEDRGDSFIIDDFDMMISDECLHPDSKIRMGNNTEKKIKDIEIGERVMSYNEDKEIFESKEVTERFVEDMNGEWWEIIYGQDKKLLVTSDHEIWTPSGWTETQNLTEGDIIKTYSESEDDEVKEVKETQKQNVSDKSYDLTVKDNHNFVGNDLLVHNCHHLPAEQWLKVALSVNAYYRYGLSATVDEEFRDNQSIKIVAGVGPNDVRVDPGEIIEKGYLAEPEFEWLLTKRIDTNFDDWQDAYSEGIVKNEDRNDIITDRTQELREEGRRVLIDVKRIEHGERILNQFDHKLQRTEWNPKEDDLDLEYDFDPSKAGEWPIPIVHNGEKIYGWGLNMVDAIDMAVEYTDGIMWVCGEDDKEIRRVILDHFRRGNIDSLISTLLREGVDIPEIDAVVLAGGGKSPIQLIQTIGRSLRPEGSDKSKVIDVKDMCDYLENHTRERYKAMKSYYGDYCSNAPPGY